MSNKIRAFVNSLAKYDVAVDLIDIEDGQCFATHGFSRAGMNGNNAAELYDDIMSVEAVRLFVYTGGVGEGMVLIMPYENPDDPFSDWFGWAGQLAHHAFLTA